MMANELMHFVLADSHKLHNIQACSNICPGNVKTNMNMNGILDADICAKNLINILESSNDELNGKFIDLKKTEIPW